MDNERKSYKTVMLISLFIFLISVALIIIFDIQWLVTISIISGMIIVYFAETESRLQQEDLEYNKSELIDFKVADIVKVADIDCRTTKVRFIKIDDKNTLIRLDGRFYYRVFKGRRVYNKRLYRLHMNDYHMIGMVIGLRAPLFCEEVGEICDVCHPNNEFKFDMKREMLKKILPITHGTMKQGDEVIVARETHRINHHFKKGDRVVILEDLSSRIPFRKLSYYMKFNNIYRLLFSNDLMHTMVKVKHPDSSDDDYAYITLKNLRWPRKSDRNI
jgi:hypothetical protein